MKTFKDLNFNKHHIGLPSTGTQAIILLNANKLSVLCGASWYSNGVDTYEIYSEKLNEGDPIGWLSKEQVTEYMIELQQ